LPDEKLILPALVWVFGEDYAFESSITKGCQ